VTLEESAAAAGLDRAAVRARVEAGQVNTAPPAPGRTVAQILRANVLTRFNAILGVGLWVLALVAGRPAGRAIALVAAMAGSLVLLFAVPQARRIFALELPPASVCAWVAGVVLAAITGLTLWRRVWSRRAA